MSFDSKWWLTPNSQVENRRLQRSRLHPQDMAEPEVNWCPSLQSDTWHFRSQIHIFQESGRQKTPGRARSGGCGHKGEGIVEEGERDWGLQTWLRKVQLKELHGYRDSAKSTVLYKSCPLTLTQGPGRQSSWQRVKLWMSFANRFSRWACCTSVWRLWTMDLAVHSAREMPTWEPLLCVIKGRVNGKKQLGKNALQVLALWSQGCHGDFVPSNFMSHFAMSLLIQFPTSPVVLSRSDN